jgi:hypothetical protein
MRALPLHLEPDGLSGGPALFCDRPINEQENPQQVLLERRPDIQHLPLTCENTNTPLPYIDVVNEALEYYITNSLTLDNYTGHSTDGDVKPEELLASPQFVSTAAYDTLKAEFFPPPLPFHQPLENMRRYFERFEVPLPEVMKALSKDDSLDVERTNLNKYGWRDILMEELRLSRAEHKILTNYDRDPPNTKLSLHQLYGYAPATSEAPNSHRTLVASSLSACCASSCSGRNSAGPLPRPTRQLQPSTRETSFPTTPMMR